MIHLINILVSYAPNPTLLRIQSQTTFRCRSCPRPSPPNPMVSSSLSEYVCNSARRDGEGERGNGGRDWSAPPFHLMPRSAAAILTQVLLSNPHYVQEIRP